MSVQAAVPEGTISPAVNEARKRVGRAGGLTACLADRRTVVARSRVSPKAGFPRSKATIRAESSQAGVAIIGLYRTLRQRLRRRRHDHRTGWRADAEFGAERRGELSAQAFPARCLHFHPGPANALLAAIYKQTLILVCHARQTPLPRQCLDRDGRSRLPETSRRKQGTRMAVTAIPVAGMA
jgi:hypothetical protein